MHSQRAARSFVRGLEIRLKAALIVEYACWSKGLTIFNDRFFKFRDISDSNKKQDDDILFVFNRSHVEQIPHRCTYIKYKETQILLVRLYTRKNASKVSYMRRQF